jgi:hypothetical protein
VAGKTSYKASKVGGIRSDPPEVAREILKKKDVPKAAATQPKGECDPESDLPFSCPCPCPCLPMPAKASNRKVLYEFIKNHFKAGLSTPARGSTGQSPLGPQ